MYLKRNSIPRSWPLPKKGSRFVVVPRHSKRNGIPLLIVLRDMLRIAENKKEVKRILNSGNVLVNNHLRRDERFPLVMFDILSIKGLGDYRVELGNRRFKLREVSGEESRFRISKIIGKRILKRGKLQISLLNGDNLIVKDKNAGIGNSVIIDVRDGKIVKYILVREKARAMILTGKHLGKEGVVEKLEGRKVNVLIGNKRIVTSLDNIMVIA